MIYYGTETHYNSLSHHGVKGMKWGVRKQRERGITGSRQSTMYEPRLNVPSREKVKENQAKIKKVGQFLKEHKKQIAIGAAVVAGTALVAYGAYKLNDRRIQKHFVNGYNAVANASRNGVNMLVLDSNEGTFKVNRGGLDYITPKTKEVTGHLNYNYDPSSSRLASLRKNGVNTVLRSRDSYDLGSIDTRIGSKSRFMSSQRAREAGANAAYSKLSDLNSKSWDQYKRYRPRG